MNNTRTTHHVRNFLLTFRVLAPRPWTWRSFRTRRCCSDSGPCTRSDILGGTDHSLCTCNQTLARFGKFLGFFQNQLTKFSLQQNVYDSSFISTWWDTSSTFHPFLSCCLLVVRLSAQSRVHWSVFRRGCWSLPPWRQKDHAALLVQFCNLVWANSGNHSGRKNWQKVWTPVSPELLVAPGCCLFVSGVVVAVHFLVELIHVWFLLRSEWPLVSLLASFCRLLCCSRRWAWRHFPCQRTLEFLLVSAGSF